MKILVTGGAGFIGSHIVDAYLSLGHNVTVIDNLSTGRRSNLNPAARFVEADIRDQETVRKTMAEGRFELVNHQAAQMDVRRSVNDPVFDASVNILGFLTLMEEAVRTEVKTVIFASSGGAIYGEQDSFPADERHAVRPISPYGVAKQTTERYLFFYRQVYGMNVVSLRYANVYGPRQNPHGEAGVVAIFTTKFLNGGQPVINGDGKQTRDYVYVSDVVNANQLALAFPGSAELNVGTGVETDVNRIYRLIAAAVGSTAEEVHGEAKLGEQRRSVLDNGLIHRTLGWEVTVALGEGIPKTVEHFRRNR